MAQNYIDYKMGARASTEFKRSVVGKTGITTLANGRESRNAEWLFKKMKFHAAYAMLSDVTQRDVLNAFYAANAQLLLFRFRDYGDYQVTNSPLSGTTSGTMNPVQLTKRYTFGPASYDRMIQAVSSCTVAGKAGTFDSALGIFTPSSNWGSGTYTWSGVFDCWVRFASDELDVTMLTWDIANTEIELIEAIAQRSP